MQSAFAVAGALGSVALVLLAVVIAFLLYRAVRQAQGARALRIRTPNGIEEGRYISIAGGPQWIQIRGERRDNPIVLMLHGGPGFAHSGFTQRFQCWERDFTVAQWDQPGAGKTASRGMPTEALTIDSMVRDGIEVTEWILRHLGQRKLILLGVSWGTVLGTEMIRRRPALFSAYVGAGQVVSMARGELVGYQLALERAQLLADEKTRKALLAVGAPPYPDSQRSGRERRALGRVGVDTFPNFSDLVAAAFCSPGYSLKDGLSFLRGISSSVVRLLKQMLAYDAWQRDAAFGVPMFFLQGALDLHTPARCVQEFYDAVEAPHKELILWEQEGHLTVLAHPDMALKALVERVRPYTQQG